MLYLVRLTDDLESPVTFSEILRYIDCHANLWKLTGFPRSLRYSNNLHGLTGMTASMNSPLKGGLSLN